MEYKLSLITPSVYSPSGPNNCVDQVSEDFANYLQHRADNEFKTPCKYLTTPGLAYIHNFQEFEQRFLIHSEYAVIIVSPGAKQAIKRFLPRLLVFLTDKGIWQNRFLFVLLGDIEVTDSLVIHPPIRFSLHDWKTHDEDSWTELFDLIKVKWIPYVEETVEVMIEDPPKNISELSSIIQSIDVAIQGSIVVSGSVYYVNRADEEITRLKSYKDESSNTFFEDMETINFTYESKFDRFVTESSNEVQYGKDMDMSAVENSKEEELGCHVIIGVDEVVACQSETEEKMKEDKHIVKSDNNVKSDEGIDTQELKNDMCYEHEINVEAKEEIYPEINASCLEGTEMTDVIVATENDLVSGERNQDDAIEASLIDNDIIDDQGGMDQGLESDEKIASSIYGNDNLEVVLDNKYCSDSIDEGRSSMGEQCENERFNIKKDDKIDVIKVPSNDKNVTILNMDKHGQPKDDATKQCDENIKVSNIDRTINSGLNDKVGSPVPQGASEGINTTLEINKDYLVSILDIKQDVIVTTPEQEKIKYDDDDKLLLDENIRKFKEEGNKNSKDMILISGKDDHLESPGTYDDPKLIHDNDKHGFTSEKEIIKDENHDKLYNIDGNFDSRKDEQKSLSETNLRKESYTSSDTNKISSDINQDADVVIIPDQERNENIGDKRIPLNENMRNFNVETEKDVDLKKFNKNIKIDYQDLNQRHTTGTIDSGKNSKESLPETDLKKDSHTISDVFKNSIDINKEVIASNPDKVRDKNVSDDTLALNENTIKFYEKPQKEDSILHQGLLSENVVSDEDESNSDMYDLSTNVKNDCIDENNESIERNIAKKVEETKKNDKYIIKSKIHGNITLDIIDQPELLSRADANDEVNVSSEKYKDSTVSTKDIDLGMDIQSRPQDHDTIKDIDETLLSNMGNTQKINEESKTNDNFQNDTDINVPFNRNVGAQHGSSLSTENTTSYSILDSKLSGLEDHVLISNSKEEEADKQRSVIDESIENKSHFIDAHVKKDFNEEYVINKLHGVEDDTSAEDSDLYVSLKNNDGKEYQRLSKPPGNDVKHEDVNEQYPLDSMKNCKEEFESEKSVHDNSYKPTDIGGKQFPANQLNTQERLGGSPHLGEHPRDTSGSDEMVHGARLVTRGKLKSPLSSPTGLPQIIGNDPVSNLYSGINVRHRWNENMLEVNGDESRWYSIVISRMRSWIMSMSPSLFSARRSQTFENAINSNEAEPSSTTSSIKYRLIAFGHHPIGVFTLFIVATALSPYVHSLLRQIRLYPWQTFDMLISAPVDMVHYEEVVRSYALPIEPSPSEDSSVADESLSQLRRWHAHRNSLFNVDQFSKRLV